MKTPNCYKCKWRRDLPGDCHSACEHPKRADGLGVTGKTHGIKHGWFLWPWNFDPLWLVTCNGFEQFQGKDAR